MRHQTGEFGRKRPKPSAKHRTSFTEADKARTEQLNEELRVRGRGGVISISLALHAAGTPVIERVLRAVADAPPSAPESVAEITVDGLQVRWAIVEQLTHDRVLRILAVWLTSDADWKR